MLNRLFKTVWPMMIKTDFTSNFSVLHTHINIYSFVNANDKAFADSITHIWAMAPFYDYIQACHNMKWGILDAAAELQHEYKHCFFSFTSLPFSFSHFEFIAFLNSLSFSQCPMTLTLIHVALHQLLAVVCPTKSSCSMNSRP